MGRISKKAISTMNFVMRQLRGTNQEIKKKAYLSLIRPIVEYASSTWDPYRLGEVKDIEKVQRMAARRVTGRTKRFIIKKNAKGKDVIVFEKPSEMVQELGWSSLASRRKNDRLCSLFRAVEGRGGWKELREKIEGDCLRNRCRGGNEKRIVVKGSRKDVGKHSFLNRTGTEWNKLDEAIFTKSENNVKKFRKLLANL